MAVSRRLFGLCGSFLGNLSLVLIIVDASILRLRYGDIPGSGGSHPRWYDLPDLWQPAIDDPGSLPVPPVIERGPYCPGRPPPAPSATLLHAPLPPGFDPSRPYSVPRLFACVRLGEGGGVAAVRLMASTGRPRVDRRLVGAIRTQWRFVPIGFGRSPAGWHRVRLNRDLPRDPPA
jgi:hypothetical protein